jgi:hypothetical protein
MRESDMVARLERFAAAYGSDFARFPFDRPAAPSTPHAYHRHNGYFESVDGFALYGMIREHRPRRIIEIGSGHSTRLKRHNFWNEQYILHAFLMFNSAFEVLWCSNWLRVRHEQRLLAAVPGYPEQAAEPVGGGTSFWMRRAR